MDLHRWDDKKLIIVIKSIRIQTVIDSSTTGYDPVAGFCERDNES
jgi:hypothetical protein